MRFLERKGFERSLFVKQAREANKNTLITKSFQQAENPSSHLVLF